MDYGLWTRRESWLLLVLFFLNGPWSMVYSPAFSQSPSPPPNPDQAISLAETVARLDRLQSDLQMMQGNIETQGNWMKQVDEKAERNYRDMEMRLQAVESKVKLFQEVMDRSLAKLSPQLANQYKKFETALGLVQATQYKEALNAFQEFLKQYPKSTYRSDALFWIAECRNSLKDYAQAIKDYQKFAEGYPKSDKIPAVILKQGNGFLALQMNDEAKVFLKKLMHDYPNSDEAALAKTKLETLEKTPVMPAPVPVAPATPTAPTATTPATPSPAPITVTPMPLPATPTPPASSPKPAEPAEGY